MKKALLGKKRYFHPSQKKAWITLLLELLFDWAENFTTDGVSHESWTDLE